MNRKIIGSQKFVQNIPIPPEIQWNIYHFKASYTVLGTFNAVRKKPGPQIEDEPDTLAYRLPIEKHYINILGKKLVDDLEDDKPVKKTWYFIEQQIDIKDFNGKLISKEKSKGWITGEGIYKVCSWEVFKKRLVTIEKQYPANLSINEKITLVRQLTHKKDFPFDAVIGRPSPPYSGYIYTKHGLPDSKYLDSVPYLKSGNYTIPVDSIQYKDYDTQVDSGLQLFTDIDGVKLSNGEIIDLHHLWVGLDVLLNKINPLSFKFRISLGDIDTAIFKTLEVGNNVNSALWAGDIGAAVVDKLGHVASGNKFSYENVWIEKYIQRNSGKKPTETEKEHAFADYYYMSRAPENDLLADVYSFYLDKIRMSLIKNNPAISLVLILDSFNKNISIDRSIGFKEFLNFIGRKEDNKKIIENNRILFDPNYSFVSYGHYKYTGDEINIFGLLWEYVRFTDTIAITDDTINAQSNEYGRRFVIWLHNQVHTKNQLNLK